MKSGKWKATYIILLSLFTILGSASELSAQKVCKLKGIVYRDIKELDSLKNFEELDGALLGDLTFSYSHYAYKQQHIIILEKCHQNQETGKAKYEILDTINITVNSSKFCVATQCNDSISNAYYIFALMHNGSNPKKNYKIIKAWLLDLNSQTIKSIMNTNAITCYTPDQLMEDSE